VADADTDVTVPAPRLPRRPPRRRRWPRALLIGLLIVALAVGAGLGVQAWRVSNALGKIKHFPTTVTKGGGGAKSGLALPAPLLGVVTFMVFTTGSHDMTKTDAVKYGVPDVKARGTDNMTDTIVLVSVDTRSGQISYLSIPRDTWVPRYREKINEIYLTNGVQALVDEVQSITGVPVNHVVGLGFTAFGRFTDAVGGVNIRIPVPTRDAESHLLLPSAGCVHLDERTVLAFARSRHTDVYTPQQGWHRDPGASDLQRETRQQVVADLRRPLPRGPSARGVRPEPARVLPATPVPDRAGAHREPGRDPVGDVKDIDRYDCRLPRTRHPAGRRPDQDRPLQRLRLTACPPCVGEIARRSRTSATSSRISRGVTSASQCCCRRGVRKRRPC